MSPMEADCWALTMHGWGSHSRDEIPADWETCRGPDEIPHHTKPNRGRPREDRPKRQTWSERRAAYLALKQGVGPMGPGPTVGAIPTVQA